MSDKKVVLKLIESHLRGMNMRQNNKKRSGGFTIVEIMAVIIIIGLLAMVVVRNFAGQTDKARVQTTKASLRALDEAVMQFKMDTGRYPTEDEGLLVLIEQPSDVENYPEGGYLRSTELPLDAWKNEFLYIRYPESGKPYEILSYGADGEEGGEGYDADLRSTDPY
jgi:general secretion pathway protein G